MKVQSGSGKSSLYGSTNVIIMDPDDHWLYGWTGYEAAKATQSGEFFCVIKGIDLDLYVAFLENFFPQIHHLTQCLYNTSTIRYEDLLAIDQAITITQVHANSLEVLQNAYNSGQVLDKNGQPLFPRKFTATDVAARDRTEASSAG